ncbi:MAG: nicotinate (nicotinamide) nucleotide adenylyltransferase [Phycisphaerales bacterium]|nr:MAG: nicotinate (nicotinamide) nucleotide adenylyltransferase [Phycisphaerales bacterium]
MTRAIFSGPRAPEDASEQWSACYGQRPCPCPVTMGEMTALFGGSFDPVHFGHLIIARSVAEQLELDRVILLPAVTPPHKDAADLTAPAHREAMVRLAIEGEPGFDVSDYDLTRTGPAYTVQTVAHFRRQFGLGAALCWIIGGDSLAELHTWYNVRDLADQCRIVTAVRPGWEKPDLDPLRALLGAVRMDKLESDILPTPRIDISSTEIRSRVRAGRSIRFLVPEAVRDYIAGHGLYRD